MPTKPLSHSARIKAHTMRAARREYDLTTRRTDPDLARAARIRSSARWRKVRALKLARNPLCENPYGRHAGTVTATEVDHIQRLRVRVDLAFALENLQSLCSACHARKSAAERKLHALGLTGGAT
jgi:5-methylcytosine-specific restriction protein A